ncbi:MAG: hypothetical protein R3254_07670 [Thiomicrorhabdus sp.]|nr:hypothetical protein [Thiomicrorhabdus sp.]
MFKTLEQKKCLFCLSIVGFFLIAPLPTSFAKQSESGLPFVFIDNIQPSLSAAEMEWIGEKIYQNECAANPKYLTYWGKGEEFPSFGIGHFIWYNNRAPAVFYETFPEMVRFVSQYQKPPNWLIKLSPFTAPWYSKKEFDQAWSNREMSELRDWLLATKGHQAQFIIQRVLQRVNGALLELQKTAPHKANDYDNLIRQMLAFKEGRFALIDYVNFKGIGNNKEQYQGEQWGLFSVLHEMKLSGLELSRILSESEQKQLISRFVDAAKSRLALRVKLSPASRSEERWLKGWFKRLDGYIE